jgi:hypothetical protein
MLGIGVGGRGDRQPGLEREIRNKWWCGGGQGLAKCLPWPGQCPLGWGILENGPGRDSGYVRTGPVGTHSCLPASCLGRGGTSK